MTLTGYVGTGINILNECDAEIVGESESFPCPPPTVYVLWRAHECVEMPVEEVTLWELIDYTWVKADSWTPEHTYNGYIYVEYPDLECGYEYSCQYSGKAVFFSTTRSEPEPEPEICQYIESLGGVDSISMFDVLDVLGAYKGDMDIGFTPGMFDVMGIIAYYKGDRISGDELTGCTW